MDLENSGFVTTVAILEELKYGFPAVVVVGSGLVVLLLVLLLIGLAILFFLDIAELLMTLSLLSKAVVPL